MVNQPCHSKLLKVSVFHVRINDGKLNLKQFKCICLFVCSNIIFHSLLRRVVVSNTHRALHCRVMNPWDRVRSQQRLSVLGFQNCSLFLPLRLMEQKRLRFSHFHNTKHFEAFDQFQVMSCVDLLMERPDDS